MVGRTLAHYQILEKIGAGGMGVVYRARDTQLGRVVALKVVGEQAQVNANARERLLREARTASALNHPNICTIHEAGVADGVTYIAMELVEGQPLSAMISGDGLPVEVAIRYGVQIADALAHAHDRRVVHRDLKSANVIVTPEGRPKVLDFGLAKAFAGEPSADPTRSPTLTAGGTLEGVILGTSAYMSPEQARGKPVDKRIDVWSMSRPEAAVEDKRDMREGRTRYRHRPALPEDLSRAVIQAARAIRKHYPIQSRIEADREVVRGDVDADLGPLIPFTVSKIDYRLHLLLKQKHPHSVWGSGLRKCNYRHMYRAATETALASMTASIQAFQPPLAGCFLGPFGGYAAGSGFFANSAQFFSGTIAD